MKRLLKRGDSVSDTVVQYTVLPRPIPERAQPPTLSRQVSKGNIIFKKTFQMLAVLTGVIFGCSDVLMGRPTVTEDEIERKSHALLSEYFANEKIEVNINARFFWSSRTNSDCFLF